MIHLQVQGSKCNSSTFEMGSGGLFGDMQIFFFFFCTFGGTPTLFCSFSGTQ